MSMSIKRPWRVRKRYNLLPVNCVYVKWAVSNQLIGGRRCTIIILNVDCLYFKAFLMCRAPCDDRISSDYFVCGVLLQEEFTAHDASVNCVACGHKSGQILVTGGEDKKVNFWAVGQKKCLLVN